MSEMMKFQAVAVVCLTVGFVASLQAIMRYLELRQKRVPPANVDALHERLAHIELTVDATAIEVERISEANRFMSRLLSDRAGVVPPVNRPERVITPH
jgi:hypothetical protein